MPIVQWPPDFTTDQPAPVSDRFQDTDRHVGAVLRRGTNFIESILGKDAWKFINSNGIADFARNPIISGIYEEPSLTTPSLLSVQADSFISQPKATLTYKWDRGDGDWIPGATNQTYQTQAADVGLALRCNVTITNITGNESGYSNQIVIEDVEETEVFEMEAYALENMSDIMQITVYNLNTYVVLGMINPWEAGVLEASIYVVELL